MLGYRHGFHAGNHADVLKHGVLARSLAYLVAKDRPLLYLETHAGAGRYRLDDPRWQTGEAAAGIGRIWQAAQPPALLAPYWAALRTLNAKRRLIHYPGSPLLARLGLRPGDRGVLYELHPNEVARLTQVMAGDGRFRVYGEDGFGGLKAHLPPREHRGLLVLDPSYELDTDYRRVPAALAEALRRFATGQYLIWYPLLGSGQARAERMLQAIIRLRPPATLRVELRLGGAPRDPGLVGSGLLLVNPPWVLEAELREALPWLVQQLAGPQGSWRLDWLVATAAG